MKRYLFVLVPLFLLTLVISLAENRQMLGASTILAEEGQEIYYDNPETSYEAAYDEGFEGDDFYEKDAEYEVYETDYDAVYSDEHYYDEEDDQSQYSQEYDYDESSLDHSQEYEEYIEEEKTLYEADFYEYRNEDFEAEADHFSEIVNELENEGIDASHVEELIKLMESYMGEFEMNFSSYPQAAIQIFEEQMQPIKGAIRAELQVFGVSVEEEDSFNDFQMTFDLEDEVQVFFEDKPGWLSEKLYDQFLDSGTGDELDFLADYSKKYDFEMDPFIDRLAYLDPEFLNELMNQKIEQLELADGLLEDFSEMKEADGLEDLMGDFSEFVFPSALGEEVAAFLRHLSERLSAGEADIGMILDDAEDEMKALMEEALHEKVEEGLIPFEDVSEEEWYATFVQEIKDLGLVSGYEDGTYGPGNSITVAEILKIVLSLAHETASGSDSMNPNVDGHWAEKYFALAEAMELSLVRDANQDPNRFASRAEVIRLMLEVGEFNVSNAGPVRFGDVDPDADDADYIEYAATLGVISGDPDGNFRPDDFINRAEVAKIMANFASFFASIMNSEEFRMD